MRLPPMPVQSAITISDGIAHSVDPSHFGPVMPTRLSP